MNEFDTENNIEKDNFLETLRNASKMTEEPLLDDSENESKSDIDEG